MWTKFKAGFLRWIRHVFQVPVVDWHLIYVAEGVWTSYNKVSGRSHYKILYSTLLRQFKLELEGQDPKDHSAYGEVLKVLVKLEIELLKTDGKWKKT